MSWNNQGGPWRSPGRGPWGQGPFGPPPTGDLEEIIRRVQEALGKLTPGGSGAGGKGLGGRGALFLALAALLLWFAWGTFYTVQPSEVGINLVFGRYTGKTAAGLNTNWPWPIGSVIKVPVWDQQITEVGYRSLGASADIPEESQMLTGDKNIVDVQAEDRRCRPLPGCAHTRMAGTRISDGDGDLQQTASSAQRTANRV